MKNVYEFLKLLCVHNNREWFDANRALYKSTKEEFETIVAQLIHNIKQFDDSIRVVNPRECTFRINRDTRFSHDKSPYKTNMGAFITPLGKNLAHAGYYLHVEPDNSFVAGGIYLPPADVLARVRTAIFHDPSSIVNIVNKHQFKECFGGIDGEKLKTTPKGFPKDFEYIDFLRFKSYTVTRRLDDDRIISGEVVAETTRLFGVMSEFNTYLNKCLE